MLGRPSSFTQDIADAICSKLAEGESLRSICIQSDMPSTTTVKNWLRDPEKKDFLAQYAQAREDQADFLAEEILQIADESGFDGHIVDGKVVVDGEAINRARLRVDARKWYAGKVAPKKYGDKIESDVTVKGGITVTITSDDASL